MLNEKILQFKSELRTMRKEDLLRMVSSQKERKCVLGGLCRFLLEYRRILFCVSEILGQGCQVERQRLDSGQEAESESESSQRPKELCVGTSQLLIFGRGPGFGQE